MQTAKDKVKVAVEEYSRLFPGELEAFKVSQSAKDELLGSNKFAQVRGSDMIERKLYELPEKLFNAIRELLTEDEWTWFQDATPHRGVSWFLMAYPIFKSTKAY